jgi:hypothetical protein
VTLIVAAANMKGTVMVGDRRLSRSGKPDPKEVTKIGAVVCNDARVLVGFSGLAELPGGVSMHQWLPETIGLVVRAMPSVDEWIPLLADRLTTTYATLPNPHRKTPLSVLVCGYQYRPGASALESKGVGLSLEGPHVSDRFIVHDHLATNPPGRGYYTAIGQVPALASSDLNRLADLILAGRPWRAQAAKTVELMTEARKSVPNTVGGDFSILYLDRDLSTPIEADFYSSVPTTTGFFGFYVDPSSSSTDWSVDVASSRTGPTAHLWVPKVGRNAPCPCGSGQKYKRCHGR